MTEKDGAEYWRGGGLLSRKSEESTDVIGDRLASAELIVERRRGSDGDKDDGFTPLEPSLRALILGADAGPEVLASARCIFLTGCGGANRE